MLVPIADKSLVERTTPADQKPVFGVVAFANFHEAIATENALRGQIRGTRLGRYGAYTRRILRPCYDLADRTTSDAEILPIWRNAIANVDDTTDWGTRDGA